MAKHFKKHITTAERKALPKSDFALPGHGTGKSGKGPGSYPIDTEARARNALARGAQHASPAELAEIKRKVHAKYPDIDSGKKKDRRKLMYDHPRSRHHG